MNGNQNLRFSVIYDQDCGFCTRCTVWASNHLPATAEYLSQVNGEKFGLSQEQVHKEVWLIDNLTGKKYGGHRAVAKLLNQPKAGWFRILGALISAGGPVSAWGYRLVARNRGRITAAC